MDFIIFPFKRKDTDSLCEAMVSDQFRYENRNMLVYYLYGDNGTGKTRSIYEMHPAADICRITDYVGKTLVATVLNLLLSYFYTGKCTNTNS